MRLRELPSERAQRCCRNHCSLRSASYIALWDCDHAPGDLLHMDVKKLDQRWLALRCPGQRGVRLGRRVEHREKIVEEVDGHRGLHIVVAQHLLDRCQRRRTPRDPLSRGHFQ